MSAEKQIQRLLREHNAAIESLSEGQHAAIDRIVTVTMIALTCALQEGGAPTEYRDIAMRQVLEAEVRGKPYETAMWRDFQ